MLCSFHCWLRFDDAAPAVGTKYQNRISGPLNIHIKVPRVDYKKLSGNKLGKSSDAIHKRVHTTRDIQNQRFANSTDVVCKADMRIGRSGNFANSSISSEVDDSIIEYGYNFRLAVKQLIAAWTRHFR